MTPGEPGCTWCYKNANILFTFDLNGVIVTTKKKGSRQWSVAFEIEIFLAFN